MPALRHVVTLTLVPTANQDQIEALLVALDELPGLIPEIRQYSFGLDAGLGAGNSSMAIVADFDSIADYETYRDHPAHRGVIDNVVRPILATRSAVQFQT